MELGMIAFMRELYGIAPEDRPYIIIDSTFTDSAGNVLTRTLAVAEAELGMVNAVRTVFDGDSKITAVISSAINVSIRFADQDEADRVQELTREEAANPVNGLTATLYERD